MNNFALKTAVVFLMMVGISALADTITLQEGLNGYGGCQDSFYSTEKAGNVRDSSPASRFGLDSFLMLNSEHYYTY